MTERPCWHIPVRLDDVPETGLHLALLGNDEVRASLAAFVGLRDLSRLEAVIDVVREGHGLRATGRVRATAGQNCVITLEPVESEIDEAFNVRFVPAASAGTVDVGDADASGSAGDADESPEAMVDGTADVGAVATEFLLLGIDPYPRKPGAVFDRPSEGTVGDGPFAALAKLRNQ
jgi:hypothetical protein